MLISKIATLKYSPNIYNYYNEKGYEIEKKRGFSFEVKVEDLSLTSNARVIVQCDLCLKIYETIYCNYTRNIGKIFSCKECKGKKAKITCLKKYGVENTSQLETVKEKRKNTNLEKYGVECNLSLKETQERIRKTMLDKYGVERLMGTEIFLEKSKNTLLNKYGVENVMFIENVKEKVRNSLYENGTCPTSKAQRYLHNLLGGELNYPVGYYNLDIYFKELNVYIEYDGSGHNLNVLSNQITDTEFKNKECARYNYLKKQGLKMIKFINLSDKLPNDETIVDIFNYCINELKNDNINHIEINLDNL